ncbi:Crp/Fnr family transcriptional regulator [Cohnella soli]|uniref:Crp/Fnr family transcriptional regulator n=1 Tax=Cohnella soli TaxID=425005 RepID=A0ABW0HQ22_9BACL
MKVSLEYDEIHSYITQFDLKRVFSEWDTIPFQLRIYEKDEVVLREGDELDGIYLLVEGQTKVTTSVETGKSLLLRFCHPLSIFGDIELIQKVAIQSQVEAVADTRLLFVAKQTVEKRLMQDYRFLNELLKHLSFKLQTCTSSSKINLLATVEERFAIYLVTTRLSSGFSKEIHTLNIPEIASLLGTTTRHLNRVIDKLSEAGILSRKRGGFVVIEGDKLNDISAGLRYE